MPSPFSSRTVSRSVTVFREKREIDLVMMWSIFPTRQSVNIAASVEKILLQSRKHISASYSACVIAAPPSDTTVYFRVWDSQWLGRRVIRKLSFTKFPYKTKVHRNLTSPAHNYGLLRLDYDEIFKVSLLIRKNLLESAKRL